MSMKTKRIYFTEFVERGLGLIISLKKCCIFIQFSLRPVPFWLLWRDAFGIGWTLDKSSSIYAISFGYILVNVEFM